MASKIRSEPRTSEHKQLYQTDSDNWYEEEHENSNGNSISISSGGGGGSSSSCCCCYYNYKNLVLP